MKRWLIWFTIGFSVFFLSVMTEKPGPHALGDIGALSGLLGIVFLVWGVITLWAVPIGVIYWLVKGKSRST